MEKLVGDSTRGEGNVHSQPLRANTIIQKLLHVFCAIGTTRFLLCYSYRIVSRSFLSTVWLENLPNIILIVSEWISNMYVVQSTINSDWCWVKFNIFVILIDRLFEPEVIFFRLFFFLWKLKLFRESEYLCSNTVTIMSTFDHVWKFRDTYEFSRFLLMFCIKKRYINCSFDFLENESTKIASMKLECKVNSKMFINITEDANFYSRILKLSKFTKNATLYIRVIFWKIAD